MSSVDAILAKLEELAAKVGYLQADVHALRQDIDENRQEYRHEITGLRSDLAAFVNRFTTAVDDTKKKPTGMPISSRSIPPNSPKSARSSNR